MSDIVVVSGQPEPQSTTLRLAASLGQAIAARQNDDEPTIVDTSELSAGLLTPGHAPTAAALAALQDASLLIVATQASSGTFTGILKLLFDQLPANGLAGTYAIPVVTAALLPQAELAEAPLRKLLGELGASVADFGLTAADAELADVPALASSYLAATLRLPFLQPPCAAW